MNVWYAAYGSNMSRARFGFYLQGGRPRGASHTYPGCRDASPPSRDEPGEIPLALAFGGTSRTWGGGVALVEAGPHRARARLYLVTLEQFEDVLAQENWLEPGAVSLGAPPAEPLVLDGTHAYRVVVPVGEHDGAPVLTITQPAQTKAAAPSRAYLAHIIVGLREAHGMSDVAAVEYLAPARGISGLLSFEELSEAVRTA